MRRTLMKMTVIGFAALFMSAAGCTQQTASAPQKDIVETAQAAGQFDTLLAAAAAAGLVDTLKSPGPLTVFAPTDAAFAKLPTGTVESLLEPANKDALAAILTYHVVGGNQMSGDVVAADRLTTVNGADVDVKVSGSTVIVNDAKVVAVDIAASNGVIHVIDTVLIPPAN